MENQFMAGIQLQLNILYSKITGIYSSVQS